ncbi:hypothetical protein ACFFGJ_01830 [Cellulomonas phragmiteti]
MLERSPEAGDVGAVDDLVAGFVTRAERFESRAGVVRAAGQQLVSVSVGAWASALGQRATRIAAGLDDSAGGCRQVAGVLARYGAALRGLERRVMVARHEVGTARIRAVAARERYAAAALAGGAASVPWAWSDVPAFPAVPAAAGELRVWQAAVQDAAAGLRAFRACCDEREDLDRATAARLVGIDVMTAYAPGTGVDAVIDVPLVQAVASAAAGTVTAEQARVMAVWFVETAERLSGDPGDETLAAFTGFLQQWGDDAELMATVFAGVGGIGTVRLVTLLGEQMFVGAPERNAALAAAGSAVRSALVSASSTWSTSEAEEFAAGMVQEALRVSGTLSAIGYVFADPRGSRMSATFTIAMADALDRIEQGGEGTWRAGPGSPGHMLDTAGMLTSDGGAHDAAARVFETLGEYPQSARDWLTGAGLDWSSEFSADFADDRVEYWFGRREWGLGGSDGFVGIAALWAGVQAEAGNLPVNVQIAAINASVLDELSGNPSLSPLQVAGEGSANLARALAGQLPGLVEVGFERGYPKDKDAGYWIDATVPYIEGTIVTARVSRDWVRPVLTAAVADDAARAMLHAAALEYQEQILTGVVHGPASASEALESLVAVWGGIDGATYSAAEVRQYLYDQQVSGTLNVGKTAIGIGASLAPGGMVTAVGVEIGLSYLQHLAEEALTGGPLPESATHSAVPSSVGSLDEFFAVSVEEYRRLGLWDKTSGHAGDFDSEAAKDIARDLVSDYENVVSAMRMSASDRLKGDAG